MKTTNRKRAIVAGALALTLTATLTACGTDNPKTTPEGAVTGFLEAVSRLDTEQMLSYLTSDYRGVQFAPEEVLREATAIEDFEVPDVTVPADANQVEVPFTYTLDGQTYEGEVTAVLTTGENGEEWLLDTNAGSSFTQQLPSVFDAQPSAEGLLAYGSELLLPPGLYDLKWESSQGLVEPFDSTLTIAPAGSFTLSEITPEMVKLTPAFNDAAQQAVAEATRNYVVDVSFHNGDYGTVKAATDAGLENLLQVEQDPGLGEPVVSDKGNQNFIAEVPLTGGQYGLFGKTGSHTEHQGIWGEQEVDDYGFVPVEGYFTKAVISRAWLDVTLEVAETSN